MSAPIFFKPIYQERVWGARNLSEALGRDLPDGKVIGEAWEVVDRPEAQSVVASGEFEGKTIRELISENATAIMGEGYDPQRPFPILVKWLDCADRLSLQVHPPAKVAPRLKGEPKTENWYIADSKPGSSLIVGLKEGATREEFERRLEDGSLEECIHRFKVEPGDSILVESGRLHAIDAGNLILEIQQNSDTTYRVYDWGRVGLDGQPRQLHIEESLASIEWNDFEPSAMKTAGEEVVLADCEEFRLVKYTLSDEQSVVTMAAGEGRLLSPVEGEVLANGVGVTRGDNVLLSADSDWEITGVPGAAFLVTERFV
ncbi:type I phosphomannose isomerase catalytic subunit [Pelagicoccus sp. SDUM812002]|uniref:type I phosphomannose isomerase catalytic subunit n=1 Tax=Pelagicoccus sp. SDUM812002 TaxID=3041266 RepID=UPI00280D2D38|nr:type I phosphomannose isomerase catalytic subunit [Pelagicoccus sp. SDUM812002]MDQ8185407.1 class I mannose-6-phosphate isomerase [Pelagicoccus sp. SDUM812002]